MWIGKAGEIYRSAELDGPYRYELTRRWDERHRLAVVLVNPSTANELDDDPTSRWLMSFARAHGFGGVQIGNLYALRSSKPTALAEHPDPVGPRNNAWLRTVIQTAAPTGWLLVGWGNGAEKLPSYRQRVRWLCEATADRMIEMRALGVTKSGAPWHPLRRRLDTQPVVWNPGSVIWEADDR